jgi:hypothetical protein
MLTVSDIWDSSSHWNLSAISFILSPDLLKILQAIPQPLNPTDADGQFWCFSRNGTFISKSAYRIALNLETPYQSIFCWKWIWKLHTIP